MYGITFGCLFATLNSLYLLWPFAWTISCSIGTLQGGFVFSEREVTAEFVATIFGAVGLFIIAWNS